MPIVIEQHFDLQPPVLLAEQAVVRQAVVLPPVAPERIPTGATRFLPDNTDKYGPFSLVHGWREASRRHAQRPNSVNTPSKLRPQLQVKNNINYCGAKISY